MKLVCLYCGKTFEGENAKYCSKECEQSHADSIKRRVKDAVEHDPSHTKKLSDYLD